MKNLLATVPNSRQVRGLRKSAALLTATVVAAMVFAGTNANAQSQKQLKTATTEEGAVVQKQQPARAKKGTISRKAAPAKTDVVAKTEAVAKPEAAVVQPAASVEKQATAQPHVPVQQVAALQPAAPVATESETATAANAKVATAPGTDPVEPGIDPVETDPKADEGGDCPVCHKNRDTQFYPCNSVVYRRHIAHGDPAATCGATRGSRAE